LIANISGKNQDIQNRKDMWPRTILPTFDERGPVNFGPLSTKQYMWLWTNPRRLYSSDYILALRGSWPLNFLHELEFEEGLLAHIANRVESPLKNFNGQHLKLGLKFHVCAPVTLGVVTFYQAMCLIGRVIKSTLILQEMLLQKLGGQNSSRFLATFDFVREYLRNEPTYRKSEKYMMNNISSPIGRKNW